MDVQLVVNPRAGDGRGLPFARSLSAELERHGHRVRMGLTEKTPSGGVRLPASLGESDCLLCVAGDNTLSKIAPEAIANDTPVVSIPFGFGNLFAREFGFRADIDFVVHLLETGTRLYVDVGVEERRSCGQRSLFLSTASYGLLDSIKQRAESHARPRRRLHRRASYAGSALRALLSPGSLSMLEVRADGSTLCRGAAVVVASNVPAFPGHLLLTPYADPTDGLLEVCAVTRTTPMGVAASLWPLVHGGTAEHGVVRARARVVELRVLGARLAEPAAGWALRVLPRRLPVLVPPDYVDRAVRPAQRAA